MPKPMLWTVLIGAWLICIGSASPGGESSETLTVIFAVLAIILGYTLRIPSAARETAFE